LVALGDPKTLERHLDQALEAMRLCASDPLCAEHHPIKDGLTLHGAACHACLFLPETSCERGNKYVDRSVLVSTVESGDLAFFTKFAEAVPEATITAQTDESVSPPRPLETALSETDERVELCDERCQEFVRSWSKWELPPPEIGYEIIDGTGRICAQAELAWPEWLHFSIAGARRPLTFYPIPSSPLCSRRQRPKRAIERRHPLSWSGPAPMPASSRCGELSLAYGRSHSGLPTDRWLVFFMYDDCLDNGRPDRTFNSLSRRRPQAHQGDVVGL